MAQFFQQAQIEDNTKGYPIGDNFKNFIGALSRDELRSIQERRFALLMEKAWNNPFYKRRWQSVGLEPNDISGLDDLQKIPSFSKNDLMESVERFPPFGDFVGPEGWQVHQRIVMHTTSGTTGAPQPLFYGARDREIQNLLLARAYLFQGLLPTDVVHSVYGFGMVNGGHYIREAILHYTNALLLSAGTGLETRSEQQVDFMRRYGVNVIVGFSDYIMKLAEVARKIGLEPGVDMKIRMISGHMAGDDGPSVSEAWGGAECFDWYGVCLLYTSPSPRD